MAGGLCALYTLAERLKHLLYRIASPTDIPLLAQMNQQLREDEQSRWQMTLPQLEDRLRDMLADDYTAMIFELNDTPVAFVLYRPVEGGIHLRQFFVSRTHRRQGFGKQIIHLLLNEIWPSDARVTLDVLVHNQRGYDFWKALGFSEYAITLERIRTAEP